ncbi:MAG: CoA-binding protein [Alphaproteobacteria bacterium]|nr:CoA-binding protein [Alphaproteobacteria bacterium]
MPWSAPSYETVRRILGETRTVALVGAIPRGASRASWRVMSFLQERGSKVYPVNPEALGQEIHGEPVLAILRDVPPKIGMVDIFLRSALVTPVVDDAIAAVARFVWMHIGVIDEVSVLKAEAAGLTVVMDRCPAIEWPRLMPAA